MTNHIDSSVKDGLATIRIDDGKVNALGSELLAQIATELDRAQAAGEAVLIRGREGILSAGFDLRCPPEGWPEMVAAGARLAAQMLAFPRPLVVACDGSAVAMGGFMLLAADVRIGAEGAHRIGLNEVAIGLTLPWFGIELARHRLTNPYFDRCTVTGALLDPGEAREAGFLDRVVAPELVGQAALDAARQLMEVHADAHAATKLRVRERVIEGVRAGAQRISAQSTDW